MTNEDKETIRQTISEALEEVMRAKAQEFITGFHAVHKTARAIPHAFGIAARIDNIIYDFKIDAHLVDDEADAERITNELQAQYAEDSVRLGLERELIKQKLQKNKEQ